MCLLFWSVPESGFGYWQFLQGHSSRRASSVDVSDRNKTKIPFTVESLYPVVVDSVDDQ